MHCSGTGKHHKGRKLYDLCMHSQRLQDLCMFPLFVLKITEREKEEGERKAAVLMKVRPVVHFMSEGFHLYTVI